MMGEMFWRSTRTSEPHEDLAESKEVDSDKVEHAERGLRLEMKR